MTAVSQNHQLCASDGHYVLGRTNVDEYNSLMMRLMSETELVSVSSCFEACMKCYISETWKKMIYIYFCTCATEVERFVAQTKQL